MVTVRSFKILRYYLYGCAHGYSHRDCYKENTPAPLARANMAMGEIDQF